MSGLDLALIVAALLAGVCGTWSPCGFSMIETMGPVGHTGGRLTTLSATRWRNGLVSQLDVLDAQRSELRNRRQALQVRAAQYQSTVGLIRALGGGWSAPA